MEYELYTLIIKSASKGLSLQNSNGSFPKGHDGPWNYEDTFLRTTSHWAILIARAYELTNEKKYLDSVVKACNYLISKEARPYNYTFHCRSLNSNRDLCNGLIGQAWVLEALISVGQQLKEEKYLKAAQNVIRIHPYDFNRHSWSAVEIDGVLIGECITLNQQIWFGSMAITLGNYIGDNIILSTGIDFFSQLHKKITFTDGGIINHSYIKESNIIKRKIRHLFTQMNKNEHNSFQKTLSISYLPFLLYGIAYAIDKSPEEQIWNKLNKDLLIKAIRYIENNFPFGYLEDPDSYRWSYNPAGIEMAYILQVMINESKKFPYQGNEIITQNRIRKWLSKQIEGYFDFNEYLLNKNTNDPEILAARFYEAVRLDNYKILIPCTDN